MDPFVRIQRLQHEPEHRRRRWALGIASSLTALVAFMWFLGSFFSTTDSVSTTPKTNETSGISPVGAFWENISAGIRSFTESQKVLEETFHEVKPAAPDSGQETVGTTTPEG